MIRHFDDEEKRKRYEMYAVCPKCRGEVYWRSYNTVITKDSEAPIREEIVAHCENSSLAYRSINLREGKKLCEWRGKVSHSKDGDLVIMNFDGTPVPYRVYITDMMGFDIDYMLDFMV